MKLSFIILFACTCSEYGFRVNLFTQIRIGSFLDQVIDVVVGLDSLNIIFADFECAGDEVLVESSPPGSPAMAARLAQPTQVGLY